jgi:hypothetical protein
MLAAPLRPILVALFASVLVLSGLSSPALAHAERDTEFPDGTGSVPDYRPMLAEPKLVVCKPESRREIRDIKGSRLRAINQKLLKECEFEHIQDAVDAVTEQNTTIYVLPGTYREEPTRGMPECGLEFEERGATILSYEEQYDCPAYHNLISVFGDDNPADGERTCDAPVCGLQIEGTGPDPEAVLITGGFKEDGDWAKLNGIRGDRADGLYLRNFTIELFEFNAVYILETDGFVIDRVVGRYNYEYAFLTFAVDHGLFQDCEGYGNGDSAIYPGSASDVNADNPETGPLDRFAIEITRCKSLHNALGYSGTAGNSVYAHDNDFFNNGLGVVTDSVFPDHPGLPQDHAWFENNRIYSNNVNFYEKYIFTGICDRPPAERGHEDGTVCPVIPAPVGTGFMIAGGNHNFFADNHIYDNWRHGMRLFGVPAIIRQEFDPGKQFDTSNHNHFVGNFFGFTEDGDEAPNGKEVWWDEQGVGNCWQDNVSSHGEMTWNTLVPVLSLPDCDSGGSIGVPLTPKQPTLAPCALYDRRHPIFRNPPGCDWFTSPSQP